MRSSRKSRPILHTKVISEVVYCSLDLEVAWLELPLTKCKKLTQKLFQRNKHQEDRRFENFKILLFTLFSNNKFNTFRIKIRQLFSQT